MTIFRHFAFTLGACCFHRCSGCVRILYVCIYLLFVRLHVIKRKQHEWIIKLSVFMNTRNALIPSRFAVLLLPNKWHCITSFTVGNSIKTSQTEWKLGLMYRYTVHLRIHFDFECYVDCVSVSQWLQYGHLFVLFMAFSCKTHRARFHFDDYIVASLFLISLDAIAEHNKTHEPVQISTLETQNKKQSLKRNFNSKPIHSSLRLVDKCW